MNRHRRRTDSTHREVSDAFKACGWEVEDVHTGPLCDLVVWRRGDRYSVNVECKTVKTASTGRTVATKSQKDLAKRQCPIVTLTSAEQVTAWVQRRNAQEATELR